MRLSVEDTFNERCLLKAFVFINATEQFNIFWKKKVKELSNFESNEFIDRK